ncbi:MAG: efflux RND transporter periplasmic adaptor subunit [Alphaproteobacteria bacterium]
MIKRLAAVGLVAAALAGAGWWWLDRDAASEPEDTDGERARATVVELAAIETGTARERFRTVGEIHARDSVRLTAEAAGIIADLPIEDGDRVARDDLILRLEEDEERAALAAAEAAVAEAEAELARARELAGEDFAAERRVESARATYESANAEIERARVQLSDRRVLAPFDGRVGVVEVSPGSFLEPGTTIASLYSVDSLEVRFDLPQRVADRAEPGAEVTLGERTLELRTLTPAAAAATRTFTAIAPLGDDASERLRPGAFVDVALTVAVREDALFVPETAIQRVGEQAFVFRAKDGEAERVEVTTGVRDGGQIEVRGPLEEGERVVTAGIEKLRDGAAIRPAEEATS